MIQLKIQTKTLRSSLSQFFVFLAVCLTLYSCAGPENSDINVFMGNKMTIDYRLVVAGHLTSSDKEIIQKIVDNSFDLINQTFNYWNLDSEISQLNLLPSKTKTAISPQLYSFFQTIDQLVQISDGLFDPTIKVAHDFWLKKLKKSLTTLILFSIFYSFNYFIVFRVMR